jgi:pRiA4b ORF-3-like protein
MPRKKQPAKPTRAVSQTPTRPNRSETAAPTIFQLKITITDVRPPIWRRVQTKDCTLAKLHDIIQDSMGWTDSHLHLFEIKGEQFGLRDQWEEGDMDVGDSEKITLGHLLDAGVKKFRYTYDMGDNWDHTVLIEKRVAVETGVRYPRCVAGARACPPEDCGGAWSYGDFVEAVQDPEHERHEELLEWLGEEFDPEKFDLAEVNKQLR